MPNPDFSEVNKMPGGNKGGPKPPASGKKPTKLTMKTAAWPKYPGKSQGKSRDTMGVRRVQQYAKSEGL